MISLVDKEKAVDVVFLDFSKACGAVFLTILKETHEVQPR